MDDCGSRGTDWSVKGLYNSVSECSALALECLWDAWRENDSAEGGETCERQHQLSNGVMGSVLQCFCCNLSHLVTVTDHRMMMMMMMTWRDPVWQYVCVCVTTVQVLEILEAPNNLTHMRIYLNPIDMYNKYLLLGVKPLNGTATSFHTPLYVS